MVSKTEESNYTNGQGDGKSVTKKAIPQLVAVTVKNILLLAFGLTLGFPTLLIPGLSAPDENFNFGPEGLSWIGSILLICVPVGCILSGAISQAVGRRRAMQIVNVPFFAAWLIFRFSTAEWQIFLALALSGLTGGFLEAPVLTYVAEISEPHLRGMLSSTSSMAVILGIMILFILGTFFPWRTVALISSSFNVISFVCLFFVPESPHWLISKNRLLDARKSLAWLRGWTSLEDIEPEYKQVYRDVHKEFPEANDNGIFDGGKPKGPPEKPPRLAKVKLFLNKSFLWPYSIVITVFAICHLSGMTTLQTYAVQVFVTFESPLDKYYSTMLMGIVELVGTIFCVMLVHYTGKRILGMISLFGNGLGFIVAATYGYLQNINYLVIPQNDNTTLVEARTDVLDPVEEQLAWIPLVALVGVSFFAHGGIRVLPWILTGEVFSNDTRAPASGLCSATTYIMSFVVNKIFYDVVEAVTLPGLFWFHGAVSFLGMVILYFILPETEGKTLGEINEHFSGGQRMGDHVFRGYKMEGQVERGNTNKAFMIDEQYKFESRL